MTVQVQHVRRRLAHVSARAQISALGADEFEGYASLFGVPDGAGDVVAPGAFAASLRKRPPSRVRMLYQHFAHEPIGVWEQIREDSRGLCRVKEIQRSKLGCSKRAGDASFTLAFAQKFSVHNHT